MKIYIASDHAGFEMKRYLIDFLSRNKHEVFDCGAFQYVPEDDYPDYISVAADYVSKESRDPNVFGIVIGYSGQGEAMVANKYPGVRATVYYGGNKHILTLSREHNDANVLSLGSHFLTTGEATKAVDLWLNTKFSGAERHMRRIKKIDELNN